MECLIGEIVQNVSELSSIRLESIAIGATENRSRSRAGVLAYVVPLRFKHGSPVELRRRGKRWVHFYRKPFYREGVEILYLINFLLPRFLSLGFEMKLETVVHELYHISPFFNGDLRRFKGRSFHGNSLREYDNAVRAMVKRFLAAPHNPKSYDFLRLSLRQLKYRHSQLKWNRVKEPPIEVLKTIEIGSSRPNSGPLV